MVVDYALYPVNWLSEIRPRILKRDGHRCKFCGVANGLRGHRDGYGDFRECNPCPDPRHGRQLRIVLTVAHLHDRNPMAADDDNLAALCQACHFRHDREQHMETRRRNREARL